MTDWKQQYPVLADVNSANINTLNSWYENLPPPETDVERTVSRRIEKKLFNAAAKECRDKAPDIADKWNDIQDALERLGIGTIGRM